VVRASGGESLEFTASDGSLFRAADVVLQAGQDQVSDPASNPASGPAAGPVTGPALQFYAHPAGPADRWGRVPAWIEARSAAGGSGLWQEGLLRTGRAVFAPRHASPACARWLLALPRDTEGTAAAGGPRRAEATTSLERLAARAGTYVIVQGRLISLGKTERTRYLNFGRNWSKDLTATISVKDEAKFADWLRKQGFSFEDLPGKALEVRGFVTEDRGPKIDLKHPAQLRVLGGETARP